jgi:hypothetical protein
MDSMFKKPKMVGGKSSFEEKYDSDRSGAVSGDGRVSS